MNNPETQASLGTRHTTHAQKTNTMSITDPANITGGEHKF